MIQFTQEKQDALREKAKKFPATLMQLKQEVKEVFENQITVPSSGIANWVLYYYCPDCSVALNFDWQKPDQHICPECGRVFSGEPYDSAWWGLVNGKNCQAAFQMAIIWMVTGEQAYAQKGLQILLAYALNYENYQVHGNIPYNGPGRAGAQTLDEANFQRSLALAYDILQDYMSDRERRSIKEKLFLPGAEFLLAHRTRQLHNHEVIINSAIAVIGVLFEKAEYIQAALYDEYGLYYQLEHGMLKNGLWFEGAFSYHFYALTSFLAYEKFAKNTDYSGLNHPNYRKMMEMPLEYLEPDGRIPMLNDANYGHESHMKNLYEFAYAEFGGNILAFLLQTYYQNRNRDNIEAFLYGAEQIPDVDFKLTNFHTPIGQSGHTILRSDNGKYLLLKHDCYGGEHDHYDRLAISYQAYGKRIAVDLGTTGYGAKLHYDYYKNTGSHNTLMIGEENQAPVNARLLKYEEKDGAIYIEAQADWTEPFQMPDSFTIVQWSEDDYRHVRMKRKLIWMNDYWLEVFIADGIASDQYADWIFHFTGQEITEPERKKMTNQYFKKKPFVHLCEISKSVPQGNYYQRIYQDGDIKTQVFGMVNGQTLFDAYGPDNPSINQVAYLIERHSATQILSAHVFESYRHTAKVRDVRFLKKNEKLYVTVQTTNQEKSFKFEAH
ncbi:alginate lyase [Clostridiales bacterium COT073_COT-073]|nr:alginate lyase [Clostridiales bacterium COT073_COT-073]